MKQLALGMLVFSLVTGASIDAADAQTQIVIDAPATPSAQATIPPKPYDEYKREELEQSSRRSRNALIGTSAATVVGTAFLFPGLAKQCVTFNIGSTNEIRCTTAGKALVGIGYPLFIGGIMGVMITGIMFGVRKGKLRRLNDRIAYDKSRAVRWDPAASRFVF
jgi:hypothetical protein